MPPTTSLDVHSKKFTRAMRGYAIDEVDAFLDEVAGELARLRQERKREADAGLERADEEAIAGALVTAQRVAEQTVADAKAEAQAIVLAAEARANDLTESAKLRAHEIVETAEMQANQVREQLGQRRLELEKSIQALQVFEGDYRGRLRACVEDLMTILDSTKPSEPVAPPAPPGLLSASG
jgi:cell division initiation protein